MVRSEKILRTIAPEEAEGLLELITLVKELPPPPPPSFVLEPPAPPLRTFVRPAPKPLRSRMDAIPTPRLRGKPGKQRHLTLLPPPLPVEEAPPDKSAPPDPIGDKMREAEGARALLLEIIRRAAYDWVLYRSSTRLDQKQLAEDAYTWLFLEDEDHPNHRIRKEEDKAITGFVAICDALDLDINKVRSYVRALTPNRVMSSGRPPENSRASEHHASVELPSRVSSEGSGESIDFDALITQLMDFE